MKKEMEKMENMMTEAGTRQTPKVPKSMFDLEGEWLRLLEMAHQGFDPETGEYLTEEQIDRVFAELAGDVENKVAGCGFVLMRLKKEAEMVDEEAKRLADKKKRILAGRERLQERVRELMKLTNTSNVKKPWISVTLSKPSKNTVEVTNQGAIPVGYMTIPILPARKPIIADIKKALKAGEDVPGAKLIESKRTLTVR